MLIYLIANYIINYKFTEDIKNSALYGLIIKESKGITEKCASGIFVTFKTNMEQNFKIMIFFI